jgi:hypothetical protein
MKEIGSGVSDSNAQEQDCEVSLLVSVSGCRTCLIRHYGVVQKDPRTDRSMRMSRRMLREISSQWVRWPVIDLTGD